MKQETTSVPHRGEMHQHTHARALNRRHVREHVDTESRNQGQQWETEGNICVHLPFAWINDTTSC